MMPGTPSSRIIGAWSESMQAMREHSHPAAVASQIYRRISLFCAFSDDKLEPIAIKQIGDKFKILGETDMASQQFSQVAGHV